WRLPASGGPGGGGGPEAVFARATGPLLRQFEGRPAPGDDRAPPPPPPHAARRGRRGDGGAATHTPPLTPRARLMLAAIGFLRLEGSPMPLALVALHQWLDSWAGIGAIERGMARQGYDLSLTRHANEGWRATFYVTGREHSATSATGSAWEPG